MRKSESRKAKFLGELINNTMSFPFNIVEVGVYRGILTKSLQALYPTSTYYMVDRWKACDESGKMYDGVGQEIWDQHYQEVVDLFKDVPHTYIVREDSAKAADDFSDYTVDFCYLDAGHTYEAVKADIDAWLRTISVGGILAGHDYSGHSSKIGVVQAVQEAFGEDFSFNKGKRIWWHVVKQRRGEDEGR